MRKHWLWIGLASAVLAACTTTEQQAPQPRPSAPVYTGPVVEIGGVEPRYEPINPSTQQDYSVNGKTWHIVKDPAHFSETGLASWYGEEASGNRTATGEPFDPDALTAAHPTLPLPSYVRVTNLANGRQLVVRVNDRGPYTPGRIIDLSHAAGDRLNISNHTRVKVDYISVAPDGTLSGPGTLGTTVAKESYALPSRPDIATSTPALQTAPLPNNSEHNSVNSTTMPHTNGLLSAAQPLRTGVLEIATPPPEPATSPPSDASARSGNAFSVQVGALSNSTHAEQLKQALSARFGVSGNVTQQGKVYRVQLGRFSSRQQASAFQQRLLHDAQQPSFITATSAGK